LVVEQAEIYIMLTIEEVKKISPKKLLTLIQEAKDFIETNKVFCDMCKEYGIEPNIIQIIPMHFGDLDVSARTSHGVITLNYKLLCSDDFTNQYQYIIHETEHYLQQCYGEEATLGADEGEYLENPFEQAGFQRQLEYIDQTEGKSKAEDYVDNLLDHHDVKEDDKREELEEVLLERVAVIKERKNKLLKLLK
jgi:hypothetical protein